MNIGRVRDQIRERYIGAQDKRLLLVEGSDDVTAYNILLHRFIPDWEQRWSIVAAGNKPRLLKLLPLEPDWLGLVDRDEWDQAAIDEHISALPNLLVLPRFCLENYLINPAELWRALPPGRQADIEGGEATFREAIANELPQYRRHGALWKVVTPLWSGLRALGFKEAPASAESLTTAQDDAEIRRILDDWDVFLDPDRIFIDFQSELAAVEQASLEDQYCQWVHGKVYWENVVNPAMNRLLGQMAEVDRRKKILRKLPRPDDFQPILDRLT